MIRVICTALILCASHAAAQVPEYNEPFFAGHTHDADISTPEEILAFPMGERPATHGEIERCLRVWAAESERAELFVHGETFEGRTLYHLVISSPANIRRLDDIKADLARLGDPRGLSGGEADRLLERTPAVAWLGYSIHGDEMSGADAAIAAAWHYVSCTDDAVTSLLDDVVVIIDPLMNPDGRDRYLAQLQEMRGNLPTTDDQARLHGGRWPRGRTNHYLFDLNRDWMFAHNPETRGRIRAASAWHPHLFVDAHEMGAQDTYLFSPAREPINGNFTDFMHEWLDVFAADQSGAFDSRGWRYYTGEWADNWYPGYSDSWASFRGAIGILYEQAGVDWYGVKRPEGIVLTYRESVHHQLVSTLVNVATLHANRDEIKSGWLETRRECVDPNGRYGKRTFAVVPGANRTRLHAFLDVLDVQGFEVFELTSSLEAPGVDRLGSAHDAIELPAGTLLVPNAQPNAHYLAAMLEFDPRMTEAFLAQERRELIRRGDTEIYDITGWSIPMLLDLDAYELSIALPENGLRPYQPRAEQAGLTGREAGQGFVIDGTDDNAPALAMDLMLEGVNVRLADENFTWGDGEFSRGSLLVAAEDQPRDDDSWIDTLDRLSRARGLAAHPIETGLGLGVVADIGGEHFHLLELPRVAVLGESPVSAYDFGSIWFTLDERYRLPATYLPAESLTYADMRRYNVLVAPSGSNRVLSSAGDDLRTWVEAGGTLIATGSASGALAREGGLSDARELGDVLGELDEYEIAVLREWAAESDSLEADALWSPDADAAAPSFPWDGIDMDRPSEEELERRDSWQRQFMPPGTVVAARVDDEHWLTVGCGDTLPILFGNGRVLMAKGGVEAPLRYGVITDAPEREEAGRIGWCTIPAGKTLRIRMSGLLWPEASHRIANGVPLTRESIGEGQVILFADQPTFRASTLGSTRLFMNAVVYGPGMGASSPILP